jgi:hypothetical protein
MIVSKLVKIIFSRYELLAVLDKNIKNRLYMHHLLSSQITSR